MPITIPIRLDAANAHRFGMATLDTHLVIVGRHDEVLALALRGLISNCSDGGQATLEHTEDEPNSYSLGRSFADARSLLDEQTLLVKRGQQRVGPVLLVLDTIDRLADRDEAIVTELLTRGTALGLHLVCSVPSLDPPHVSPALRAVIEQHAHLRNGDTLPGIAHVQSADGSAATVLVGWVDPAALGDPLSDIKHPGDSEVLAHGWGNPAGALTAEDEAHHQAALRAMGMGDLEPAGSFGSDGPHPAYQQDHCRAPRSNGSVTTTSPGYRIAIECVDHGVAVRLVCRAVESDSLACTPDVTAEVDTRGEDHRQV
jgi:hypothetical protein